MEEDKQGSYVHLNSACSLTGLEVESTEPDFKSEAIGQPSQGKGDEVEIMRWDKYCYPALVKRMFAAQWIRMALLVGVIYIIQFTGVCGACNAYSDTTRTNMCTLEDGTELKGEDASKVYDLAIMLSAIYHMI